MKQLLSLIMAMLLCCVLAACDRADGDPPSVDSPTEETRPLMVACTESTTHPEVQALYWISQELEARTEGRWRLEIYTDGRMGSTAQTLEQITMGVLDLCVVSNCDVEAYVSDFAILGTPYMFRSTEHWQQVFLSDRLADLYAATEAYGFTLLSSYGTGMRGICIRDGAVSSPDDLFGLLIRVGGSQEALAMIYAMGGVGVSMAQADVYSALQSGTLDGAEVDFYSYMDMELYQAAPYYCLTDHLTEPHHLVIANDVLASMSSEDQAVLRELCTASAGYHLEQLSLLHEEYQALAAEKGVVFTECDVPAFRDMCAELIREAADRSELTRAAYEGILAEAGSDKLP